MMQEQPLSHWTAPKDIIVIEAQPKNVSKGAGLTMGKKFRPRLTVPPLSMSDLGIGQWDIRTEEAATNRNNSVQDGQSQDAGSVGTLDSLGSTSLLEHIYSRLDESTYYPNEFIDNAIEGYVTGALWFDTQGNFDLAKSNAKSGSDYLRVFVLKLLRRSFAQPLPLSLRKTKTFMVSYIVRFELTGIDTPLDITPRTNLGRGLQKGVIGNTIAIYRAAKTIGQWKLGPFSGYAIAPVIAIDPNWIISHIAKLFGKATGRKAEIDPLEIYRNDPQWSK